MFAIVVRKPWLREKLIKIGAIVVRHAKAFTFQLAEVAVPGSLFAAILDRSTAGDSWYGSSDKGGLKR